MPPNTIRSATCAVGRPDTSGIASGVEGRGGAEGADTVEGTVDGSDEVVGAGSGTGESSVDLPTEDRSDTSSIFGRAQPQFWHLR